jgi:hypothetical protein
MKRLFLFLMMSFFLSGCGQSTIESPVKTEGLTGGLDLSLVIETDDESSADVPASWETYSNTQYGYEFSYPSAGILWSVITEGENPYVIQPTAQSSRVQFTDAPIDSLLQTDVNRFVIEVIEGQRSAHEWLSQHLELYFKNGNAGQNNVRFADESGIMLVGQGTLGSPTKMIVVQRGSFTYVIYYFMDSFTFEQVLETFRFY